MAVLKVKPVNDNGYVVWEASILADENDLHSIRNFSATTRNRVVKKAARWYDRYTKAQELTEKYTEVIEL